MATLTIRNLDDRTKERLRVQAARHGHSMEEEARAILNRAVGGVAGKPASLIGFLQTAPTTEGFEAPRDNTPMRDVKL